MPPRIIPILDRLRQDIVGVLSKKAIEEAAHQANHVWRNRILDPATTLYLFLLQILHGNTACHHVVHFGGWTFTDSAYCQARKRLPLAVFHQLLETTAAVFRSATADRSRWLGHRVWLVDGSSFSMPDTPELQRHFGQPGGQRHGCGFPVAKWLALFDLMTGMLLRSATAPLRTHDMAQSAAVSRALEPGDLVLGDRGFCSYAHLALLTQRELHAVFRVHQKQIVDFTPGRPRARRGSRDLPGLPHSRWVLAQGDADQIVVWYKPKRKPSWMSAEEYAALPGEITVRELRYRIEVPGYRVRDHAGDHAVGRDGLPGVGPGRPLLPALAGGDDGSADAPGADPDRDARPAVATVVRGVGVGVAERVGVVPLSGVGAAAARWPGDLPGVAPVSDDVSP